MFNIDVFDVYVCVPLAFGDELQVATGYGSHSKRKEAKIKSAIINYLKNHATG